MASPNWSSRVWIKPTPEEMADDHVEQILLNQKNDAQQGYRCIALITTLVSSLGSRDRDYRYERKQVQRNTPKKQVPKVMFGWSDAGFS